MHGTQGQGAAPEIQIGAVPAVAEMLAADLEAHVRATLADRPRFTIAIPGGSVATRCFPRLAALAVDWSRMEFLWVDERAVPADDAESNYAVAQSLWLEPAGVPATNVHRMHGDAADLVQAARDYQRELTKTAGSPPRLDYVLLGIGSDGHVASQFPGGVPCVRGHLVIAVDDAPRPPPRRLSLALTVLMNARRVVFVAFGMEKAGVIREAVTDAGSMLPVAQVARGARSCVFLLDPAAGSQLARRA